MTGFERGKGFKVLKVLMFIDGHAAKLRDLALLQLDPAKRPSRWLALAGGRLRPAKPLDEQFAEIELLKLLTEHLCVDWHCETPPLHGEGL